MGKQRNMGTKTSVFGSPGRINHDLTTFYASKLYEGLPEEDSEIYRKPYSSPVIDQAYVKLARQRIKVFSSNFFAPKLFEFEV